MSATEAASRADRVPVLQLQGITKRFGALLANDDITLSLGRGEVLALLGALLFAFFDALKLRLRQAGGGVLGVDLPYQLYLMLPYVMAILALVVVARRASYPQALMKPYRQGER